MTSYRALVFPIVLCVASFAAFGYMYSYVQSLTDKALEVRAKATDEQLHVAQERELSSIHERTEADRARVSTMWVTTLEAVDFIEELEAFGAQAGSAVTISSIEHVSATETVKAHIRARLAAEGSWASVMKTLMLAESMPRHSKVSSARFDSVSGEGTSSGRWRLSLSIEAPLISTQSRP